jgi:predicted  nucleic acid-binding Zn-ribbon protein
MEQNIKFTAHLTENHQLKAADQLISKLRQQHAADEEYIKEIEEQNEKLCQEIKVAQEPLLKQIKELEEALAKEKASREKLCQKYSDDVQQFIKTDVLYAKYKKELDETKEERDRFRRQRDQLVYEINQLR